MQQNVLAWLLILFPLLSTTEWIISGRVACGFFPLVDIKVKLIEPGIFFTSEHGSAVTNAEGLFYIKNDEISEDASLLEKMTIRIDYSYDKGDHRRIIIADDFKKMRSEYFPLAHVKIKPIFGNRTIGEFLHLGQFNLTEVHCQYFALYRYVMKEYENETGFVHPQRTLHIITQSLAALFVSSVPFASTDTIRIPINYEYQDLATTRHEFGHTIRHSLDGSFLHLLYDTAKYTYIQSHWCRKRTNEGFAFNEGFAEFFASAQCDIDPLEDKEDYNYEDNVSFALRRLALKCHKTLIAAKKAFIQLLKRNPKIIHTFNEFLDRHNSSFSCSL